METRWKEMKNVFSFASVLLVMAVGISACGLLAPTGATPQVQGSASTEPGVETAASTATATATATATLIPLSPPTPTTAQLKLEIVQSQAWTDPDGNVRANVLLRNPYDYPVTPIAWAGANLLNKAGDLMRSDKLYYLDGISGGTGFILPGDTVAANACFTCETTPLTEAWGSVGFNTGIQEATVSWTYSTEVEATIGSVSFNGDNPIFWVTGTVKNKSGAALSLIAARVFVFDQKGDLEIGRASCRERVYENV
jgi:hypothetical protein